MKLSEAHDVLAKTVHATLNKDFELYKKSARWVTKMLYREMKQDLLRTCEVVMAITAVAFLPS
jgi:hypothetical protein